MRSETIAIHSGYDVEPTTKAVAVPIYQTVAYEFDSADHGAALFNLEAEGYRYSRIANPTTDVLERRVAALEGGVEALAVSSGQAALNYAILNLMEPGANIVSVPQLYGTTHTLFAHVLPSQGFHVRFAQSDQPAAIEKLIDHKTKGLFCESIGNPAGNICDIGALADLAHRHGIPMGGIIVDGGQFPWKQHAERFPMFCTPDASYHGLVYADHFGAGAYIARCRSVFQRTTGAVLAPLSAFLLLQGIETVALRVERHVENARRVAEFLRDDPRVGWVNYAGFADNPNHALAQKYLGGRACSLLTFGVGGGFEAGKRFYDALRLFKRLVNMGDAKSLACHPASTTHRQMSAEEQSQAGVRPEMIRLSVGIEHIDDIIADLDQALAATAADRQSAIAAE
jgi:O-acetylhomoserine (thiol)-lyase